jgi:hypothetical protein
LLGRRLVGRRRAGLRDSGCGIKNRGERQHLFHVIGLVLWGQSGAGVIRRSVAGPDLSNQTGFANRSPPPFSAKSSSDQSKMRGKFCRD